MKLTNTKNFKIEKRPDGVTVLRFDEAKKSVNTLKMDFADEFTALLNSLEQDPETKAIVLASAKKNSFVAGADIEMLSAATTPEARLSISQRAQDGMDRIESTSKPIVAAIHGTCLGGGFELALACHARVCSDHPKTKMGLPEVQLGVLPGAGGTQRLPGLIGAQQALDLLLTGRQIDAKKAKKLGICVEVVAEAILEDIAAETALSMAKRSPRPSKPVEAIKRFLDPEELQQIALEDNPVGRKILFDQANKKLMEKTRGNYPAPEKILQVVRAGLQHGRTAGLRAEREAFADLLGTPECKQLMQIFFATQALKKDTGTAKKTTAEAIDSVAVIGAGLMGAGIAYVTAERTPYPVRLKDRDFPSAAKGLSNIRKLVDSKVKRRRMSRYDGNRFMSRIQATDSYRGFEHVDVVIEAVFEDLALKHQILKDVETHGGERTIFASNTSSLPITKIAAAASRPQNVVGLHYFSPVEKMPLLEIIVTPATEDWVTATCVRLGKDQGKTVIVVNDGVGFYTTRILAPFLNEAAYLVTEGNAIDRIDGALMDFGFPVGPIKLTDEVGIDVGAKVGAIMLDAFGDRMRAPAGLERLVEEGREGKKNGRGFYDYNPKAKKGSIDATVYKTLGVYPTNPTRPDQMVERCTLQMVGEAVRCLEEGVLRSPRDGDIGAIFGLGFPPFRGGPFRYIDARGASSVVSAMNRLADEVDPRFAPCALLVDHAKANRLFYPIKAKKTAKSAPASLQA